MKLIALVTALTLVSCASTKEAAKPAALPLPTTIEEAVAGPHRTQENRARDQYRHPAETLNFFGIKPEMTVLEIAPGRGWYTEILAPYLAAKGRYIGALSNSTNDYVVKANAALTEWIKSRPELGKAETVVFTPPVDIIPPETADMVLTFRNVHNWMSAGQEKAAFEAFFRALKPGGVLGVVEHRAAPKSGKDPKAKSGYVREADVIQLAKAAGFKLDAKSEINANPKDTRNHPEGVWTLPPSLRLGEKDRQKYVDIGESDRMTLRFVKPAKK